ncbi:MAG: hypothetical protein HZB68_05515 [Candidatus Aenigmarchaeota archaeon]|nr:hypothetical protein [Candidatus Aenigmarchaeota archaeon]
MYFFTVFVKWVHYVAAAVWLGGMVLIIAMNRLPPRTEENVDALKRLGRASAPVMRMALYFAIVTGLINVVNKGFLPSELLSPGFYFSYPGYFVLAKIIIAIAVLALAFAHVGLGEAAGTKERLGPLEGARLKFIITGWVSLVLTLLLVLLGALLS